MKSQLATPQEGARSYRSGSGLAGLPVPGALPEADERTLKPYVVIGEDTYTVITAKNRLQLFREEQLFLDEPRGLGTSTGLRVYLAGRFHADS